MGQILVGMAVETADGVASITFNNNPDDTLIGETDIYGTRIRTVIAGRVMARSTGPGAIGLVLVMQGGNADPGTQINYRGNAVMAVRTKLTCGQIADLQ